MNQMALARAMTRLKVTHKQKKIYYRKHLLNSKINVDHKLVTFMTM